MIVDIILGIVIVGTVLVMFVPSGGGDHGHGHGHDHAPHDAPGFWSPAALAFRVIATVMLRCFATGFVLVCTSASGAPVLGVARDALAPTVLKVFVAGAASMALFVAFQVATHWSSGTSGSQTPHQH